MIKLIMHKYRNNQLFKHLVWLVMLKIILLTIIWLTFIKPNKLHPSFLQVTDHMVAKDSNLPRSTQLRE
jgi:hypothetical protein